MSSLSFDSIRFTVYSNDHAPRHVHGFLGETEIIIDLTVNGNVALSNRKGAVRPPNAKRSDVRRILDNAAEHFDELEKLWEKVHGTTKETHPQT